MTDRLHEITTYYQILFELLIFVAFVIVLKIVMLLLMAKLSVILSDDPEATKLQRERRKQATTFDQTPAQKWLRLGMGLLVTLSGLFQIQPRMVSISQTALNRDLGLQASQSVHGLAGTFAQFWFVHSTWMNVTSVGIQLLVGLVLLTTSNRVAVLTTSGIGALVAIYDFVAMTGFGGLFNPGSTVLGVSSVRGLVYFGMFLLFFVPTRAWRSERPIRWLQIGTGVYWLIGALLQVIPTGRFWSTLGWRQLLGTNRSTMAPSWVTNLAHGTGSFVNSFPAVVNIVLVVLMVLLGAGLLAAHRLTKVSRVIEVSSFVFITICFVIFGHVGFETVYLFPMDTGPAIALAVLLTMVMRQTHNARLNSQPSNAQESEAISS